MLPLLRIKTKDYTWSLQNKRRKGRYGKLPAQCQIFSSQEEMVKWSPIIIFKGHCFIIDAYGHFNLQLLYFQWYNKKYTFISKVFLPDGESNPGRGGDCAET